MNYLGRNIYDEDWAKLRQWLMPYKLRKSGQLAWLYALIAPLVRLYSLFTAFRNSTDYRLGIDSQVCYMEKALNDKYDVEERRIYITDSISYDPVPFYLLEENKPVRFNLKSEGNPVILYRKSETAQFTTDFLVMVPGDLIFDNTEMRSVIGSYKLPAKTFDIKTF